MRLFNIGDALQQQHEIVLIPDSYFFVETVSLPDGIEPDEVSNYLEYILEDTSPFPLDQLLWGFLSNDSETDAQVLLYAAYKPRLKIAGFLDKSDAYHLFPSFVAHAGMKADAPMKLLSAFGDSVSILALEPGRPFPRVLESVQWKKESEDEDEGFEEDDSRAFEVGKQLAAKWGIGSRGMFSAVDAVEDSDGGVTFSIGYQSGEDSNLEMLPEKYFEDTDYLWNADLRDSAFIHAEVKNRKRSQYAWQGLQYAAVAVLLMFVLELFGVLGGWELERRHTQIFEDDTAAQFVADQQQSLDTLLHFRNAELRPFDMLGILNQTRPRESMQFISVEAHTGKPMEVRGREKSYKAVQDYAERLRKVESLSDVRLPNYSISAGRVSFTMEVDFKSMNSTGDTVALRNVE